MKNRIDIPEIIITTEIKKNKSIIRKVQKINMIIKQKIIRKIQAITKIQTIKLQMKIHVHFTMAIIHGANALITSMEPTSDLSIQIPNPMITRKTLHIQKSRLSSSQHLPTMLMQMKIVMVQIMPLLTISLQKMNHLILLMSIFNMMSQWN
jgi:hypothetical protein